MQHIMVGIPVRERMWALERVIRSLRHTLMNGFFYDALAPLASMELFFLIQGVDAERVIEMTKFLIAITTPLIEEHGIKVTFDSMSVDPSIGMGRPWKKKQYQHMADVRNRLLDAAKERGASLFSLDSDVCIFQDTVSTLIHARKDIVSALVRNHPSADAYNIMWTKFGDDKAFTRDGFHTQIGQGVIEVGLTGACYLISNKVIEAGVRYKTHEQGEDAGFCIDARGHGFRVYCDTNHKVLHLYTHGEEPI